MFLLFGAYVFIYSSIAFFELSVSLQYKNITCISYERLNDTDINNNSLYFEKQNNYDISPNMWLSLNGLFNVVSVSTIIVVFMNVKKKTIVNFICNVTEIFIFLSIFIKLVFMFYAVVSWNINKNLLCDIVINIEYDKILYVLYVFVIGEIIYTKFIIDKQRKIKDAKDQEMFEDMNEKTNYEYGMLNLPNT